VSSRWVIEPVNPKSSDLTLGELPLQENARVSELKYYAPDRTLSFLLEPDKTAGPSSGTPVLSELKIVPGGDPLKVTLQDYELLDLKDAAGDRVLELTLLSPEQFTIPLSRRTRLSIQQAPGEQPAFWGDLAVNQVDFTRVLQSAKDFSNNVLDSTILSGKVRMSERQLEIEEHQFLLINGQPVRLPGIQTLLRLQVAESDRAKEAKSAEQKTELQKPGPKTSEKGLKVAISGHARKVEVGLNPRLPVSKIQATLIEQWLPRDIAIAVISFLSAIFASLATLAINRFLTKPEASS
jgi:hypothetical protein